MRHITLVTWSGTGNFGTSLQAYALERKLELLGYRVILVSDVKDARGWRLYFQWAKGLVRRLKPKGVQRHLTRLDAWKRCHLNEVRIENALQLALLRWWTSAYVTGSDQIWNTYVEFAPVRFLSFAGKGRRIAYASSIGTGTVNPVYAKPMRELLMKFDAIGVRENAAVRALSELTGRTDIVRVLDPTFILGREEWLKLADDAEFERPVPRRYMLCYLIGKNPNYASQLKDVVEKVGIKDVVLVPSLESPDAHYEDVTEYPQATPGEFVKLVANAQFVCTDSFHATALSVIFEKNFVEFVRFERTDSRSQNSRLDELLGRYGLLDRYYDVWCQNDLKPIDFTPVLKALAAERRASEAFLAGALEKGK